MVSQFISFQPTLDKELLTFTIIPSGLYGLNCRNPAGPSLTVVPSIATYFLHIIIITSWQISLPYFWDTLFISISKILMLITVIFLTHFFYIFICMFLMLILWVSLSHSFIFIYNNFKVLF